jgi:hypothetical protein
MKEAQQAIDYGTLPLTWHAQMAQLINVSCTEDANMRRPGGHQLRSPCMQDEFIADRALASWLARTTTWHGMA